MKVQLSRFCHYWDEAALETLESEFNMHLLMQAQTITNVNTCESILDDITFDVPSILEVPNTIAEQSKYFKAPWDE